MAICLTAGPTSKQTRGANKQTSSLRSKQTVKTSKQGSKQKEKEKKEKKKEKEKKENEKEKEKDKENEKEKEKEMEVWFNSFAAVCPGGAGGYMYICIHKCVHTQEACECPSSDKRQHGITDENKI